MRSDFFSHNDFDRRFNRVRTIQRLIFGVVIFIFVLMPFFTMYKAYATDEVVILTVTEKERITGKEDSKYLVFTEGEVFENTDSFWYWKWNSSDIYGDIEAGKVYEAKVYGWRIPLFSWYRNIIEVEEKNTE